MKYSICTLILIQFFTIINAQNVGIGSPTPAEKLEVNGNIRVINSDKGILLNTADAPMITRAWDPFTSGGFSGIGRWGLFMQPNRITIGMPDIFGKAFHVAAFAPNSTVAKTMFSVSRDGQVGVGIEPSLAKFQVYNDSSLLTVLPQGLVGINVDLPTAKLHIKASDVDNSVIVADPLGLSIFQIRPPFFGNTVLFGGNPSGIPAAVTISNEFLRTSSLPQLRLVALGDNLGAGSGSILTFDNVNSPTDYYRFTSYTGSNPLFHRFELIHKNPSTQKIILSFNQNDNMGVGTDVALERLTVDGNIQSTGLQGVGNRPVLANADGKLIAQSSPTMFYSLPANAFTKSTPVSTDVLSYNVGVPGGLAIITASSTLRLLAPLNLPHGATVTAVKMWCLDNSVNNVTVRIEYVEQNTGIIFANGIVSSTGTSATIRSFSISTNIPIDNNTQIYSISVLPSSGSTWVSDGSLYVKGVIIEYTL